MSILRTESLSKRFGGLKAVDAVDLELEEGEILGVIGPNGAGKTTLFSMIAGSIPPTSGKVVLESQVISGASARRAVRAGVVRTHQIVRPFHGSEMAALWHLSPAHNIQAALCKCTRRRGNFFRK